MPCNSCNSKLSNLEANFGVHHRWSDFISAEKKRINLKKKKIVLSTCNFCDLIQIKEPLPANRITPRHKWIINKEETKHHSELVKLLINKKILNKRKKFLAISHYDEEILKNLNKKRFSNLKTLNLKRDLEVSNKNKLRQEVIQNYLNKQYSKIFIKNNGKVDVIICSKVLEHTQKIFNFFEFCNKVLNKDGIIIIDVPDCKKSLKQGNISMVWEEHISYFTQNTLDNTFLIHGFKKKYFKTFFYKQENALVGVYKKNNIIKTNKNKLCKLENNLSLFKNEIYKIKKATNKFLLKFRKKKYRIILFGAGHNSIAFINYLNIKKHISLILDDNKNKKNLILPGTNLSIKNSSYLKEIDFPIICLLALNIPIEKRIIKKIKNRFKLDSKFFSIYPDSSIFFLKNVEKYK